ncbi:MAG: dTDP-4-dehydrorhamnose 3,5-epimerase family protein [Verrucomicrobiaceae bacterium]
MNREVKNIHGVTVSAKAKLHDARGWFLPALDKDCPQADWVLQNISRSNPNTLRGLHYQDPHPQAKLVTLIEGTAQDIVADLRPDSPTYLRFAVYHLDAEADNRLFIPRGCAHGFLVTGPGPALLSYLTDAPYHPDSEKTLPWNHPDWNFPWLSKSPILSPKDQGLPPE